ncbi:antitermination protein [Serratia fonticola]|uniref:antitermination protein Q n=1 Tax=Serratia fonticola TaxID=47917 RepID=UPI0024DE3BE7|nr:antitermination protein [Serratia fonticola]MDK2375277.1 antitermination protein [Serratia fonticola]
MRLESIPKYFAPKSPTFSDSPRATASDSLTITDMMAAMGLADLKGGFGLALFLAKQGISAPATAVHSLFAFARNQVSKHRAMAKHAEDVQLRALAVMTVFAYQDYSRSAASVRPCECCQGEGFIEEKKFIMNTLAARRETASMFQRGDLPASIQLMDSREMYVKHSIYETTRILCHTCGGKGEISNACRCDGRGVVVDRVKSKAAGIPITKECCKCSGRGFARLPAEQVRKALTLVGMDIAETTWRRDYKPLYEQLVTQCYREESHTDAMLAAVTV